MRHRQKCPGSPPPMPPPAAPEARMLAQGHCLGPRGAPPTLGCGGGGGGGRGGEGARRGSIAQSGRGRRLLAPGSPLPPFWSRLCSTAQEAHYLDAISMAMAPEAMTPRTPEAVTPRDSPRAWGVSSGLGEWEAAEPGSAHRHGQRRDGSRSPTRPPIGPSYRLSSPARLLRAALSWAREERPGPRSVGDRERLLRCPGPCPKLADSTASGHPGVPARGRLLGCNPMHPGCNPMYSGCTPTCPGCNPACLGCNPLYPGCNPLYPGVPSGRRLHVHRGG